MDKEEKKAIDILKHCQNTYIENTKVDKLLLTTKEAKTILNLIEKQQKEIEELKNADLTTVYLNGFYDGEKKVKDKIKAKIEELEKMYIYEFETMNVLEVLQSLLEKE